MTPAASSSSQLEMIINQSLNLRFTGVNNSKRNRLYQFSRTYPIHIIKSKQMLFTSIYINQFHAQIVVYQHETPASVNKKSVLKLFNLEHSYLQSMTH